MDTQIWQVFVDSSVLISGIISQTGASSAILDLGEAGEIKIVLSQGILVETDRVFERKFPSLIGDFRQYIKNLSPLILDDPSMDDINFAASIIDIGDAPILAAAKKAKLDFLVSLDTRHFHTPKVKAYLNNPIVTPAQFLNEFRQYFSE